MKNKKLFQFRTRKLSMFLKKEKESNVYRSIRGEERKESQQSESQKTFKGH